MAKLLTDRTAEWLKQTMQGGSDARSRRRITRWTSDDAPYQPFELAIRDTGEVDEHDEPVRAVYIRGRQSLVIAGNDIVSLRLTPSFQPVPQWIQLSTGMPSADETYILYVWLGGNSGHIPIAWVASSPPNEYTNANVKLAELAIGGYNVARTGSPAHVVNNILGNVFVPHFFGDTNESNATQKTVSIASTGRVGLSVQTSEDFADWDYNSDVLLLLHRSNGGVELRILYIAKSTLSVVTDVDFANETVTRKTIRFFGTID